MRTYFILGIIVFLISGCGNPHISSVETGLERTRPPLMYEEEETCIEARRVYDYEFHFGSHDEGQSGNYTRSFLPYSRCKSLLTETFNSFEAGESFEFTNSQEEKISYELKLVNERTYQGGKVIYLEDMFGGETFPMTLESPVVNNGATGKDQGVDTSSNGGDGKDTLLWNFSTPVSVWGVKVVGLESKKSSPSRVRLFDCDGALMKEAEVIYPKGEDGNSELHSFGFVGGRGEVCYVTLTAAKKMNAIAVDEFIYGN